MAKKKDNPGMTPDLFADFGAAADTTVEQHEEKATPEEAAEPTSAAAAQTAPVAEAAETPAEAQKEVPTVEPTEPSVAQAQVEPESEPEPEAKPAAVKNKLPAILCDDTPAELKHRYKEDTMKGWPGEPDMDYDVDRKSTRLNSSHVSESRMPSSA